MVGVVVGVVEAYGARPGIRLGIGLVLVSAYVVGCLRASRLRGPPD